MFRFLYKILIVAFSTLFFISCDKVDPPYKKAVTVTTNKKVLLEDYTGHLCVNCPTAAKEIEDLKEVYGGNLIAISVHAGFQSIPIGPPYDYDFRTDIGTTWNNEWGISTYPMGVVNRSIQTDGTRTVKLANWPVAVSQELEKAAVAEITIQASFNTSTKAFIAEVTTNIDAEPGESYCVNALLVEDSLIHAQKNNNSTVGPVPDILDYAHMHVLRASFTGTWGVSINPDIVDNKTFTLPDTDYPEDVIPENCHVVVFISKSNREIVQAEIASVN